LDCNLGILTSLSGCESSFESARACFSVGVRANRFFGSGIVEVEDDGLGGGGGGVGDMMEMPGGKD